MSRRLDRPAAVCTLAVSLAALGAALLPGTARADESLEEPLASVASVSDLAVSVAADAIATAADPQATVAPEALVGVDATPVEIPTTTDEPVGTSAPEPAPAGEPTEAPDTTAPTQKASSEADIMPTTGDTAADTPSTGPALPPDQPTTPLTDAPETVAAPATASANINVSVRIGSPGDNGAVTQLNVGTLSSPSPHGDATTTPPPATPSSTTAPSTRETTPATSAGAGDPSTWYWSWDCLDMAPVSPISPGDSGTGSLPDSWTWIWNCGGNDQQYHDETSAGYQQINANIAIRFSSPGNDGSVGQVNIAAGAAVAWPVPPVHTLPSPVQPPAISLPPLAGALGDALDLATGAFAAEVDIALPQVSAPSATIASVTSPEPAIVVPRPGLLLEQRDVASGLPPAAGPRARWHGSRLTGAVADDAAPGIGDPAATRVGGTPEYEAPGARSGAAGPPDDDSRGAGAAPRWRPPLPSRYVPAPISSASAAAVGGGSSGSGLPVLLMLPFVAVMLDLARRVALSRATWPSGHRWRVPEKPG